MTPKPTDSPTRRRGDGGGAGVEDVGDDADGAGGFARPQPPTAAVQFAGKGAEWGGKTSVRQAQQQQQQSPQGKEEGREARSQQVRRTTDKARLAAAVVRETPRKLIRRLSAGTGAGVKRPAGANALGLPASAHALNTKSIIRDLIKADRRPASASASTQQQEQQQQPPQHESEPQKPLKQDQARPRPPPPPPRRREHRKPMDVSSHATAPITASATSGDGSPPAQGATSGSGSGSSWISNVATHLILPAVVSGLFASYVWLANMPDPVIVA